MSEVLSRRIYINLETRDTNWLKPVKETEKRYAHRVKCGFLYIYCYPPESHKYILLSVSPQLCHLWHHLHWVTQILEILHSTHFLRRNSQISSQPITFLLLKLTSIWSNNTNCFLFFFCQWILNKYRFSFVHTAIIIHHEFT